MSCISMVLNLRRQGENTNPLVVFYLYNIKVYKYKTVIIYTQQIKIKMSSFKSNENIHSFGPVMTRQRKPEERYCSFANFT